MRRFLFSILALSLFGFSAEIAQAKPKKISHGCTAAQIQSPAASACIDQMERDAIGGKSHIHAVYCSSSGKILCCLYDGDTMLDHSCDVVGMTRPTDGTARKPGSDAGVVRDSAPEPNPAPNRNTAPVGNRTLQK